MDGTVGLPCMTPGKPWKWLLFAEDIRVDATDADIAISPVLQDPVDGSALQALQNAAWDAGRFGKHIDMRSHEGAREEAGAFVRSQKLAEQPGGGQPITLRHARQPRMRRFLASRARAVRQRI